MKKVLMVQVGIVKVKCDFGLEGGKVNLVILEVGA